VCVLRKPGNKKGTRRVKESKFIKGEIQNDETFAAAAATATHFEI
jgi:hypothetical protein